MAKKAYHIHIFMPMRSMRSIHTFFALKALEVLTSAFSFLALAFLAVVMVALAEETAFCWEEVRGLLKR